MQPGECAEVIRAAVCEGAQLPPDLTLRQDRSYAGEGFLVEAVYDPPRPATPEPTRFVVHVEAA